MGLGLVGENVKLRTKLAKIESKFKTSCAERTATKRINRRLMVEVEALSSKVAKLKTKTTEQANKIKHLSGYKSDVERLLANAERRKKNKDSRY